MAEESEIIQFLENKRKTRRRSSFFGFQPTPVEPSSERDAEEAYFKKLEKERNDWKDILTAFNSKIQTYWKKEKNATYDKSNLSKERQEYLDKAIDMEQYLKESDQFNKRVDLYVTEKQWLNQRYEERIESVDDLITEQTHRALL